MYYCDDERDCPWADGDEPAGDWATSHNSVNDVLVNKKSSAILMFIHFSTEENLVSFPITDEGSKPETLSKIAQTTAALTRLKPVWNDRSISLSSKI